MREMLDFEYHVKEIQPIRYKNMKRIGCIYYLVIKFIF